MSCLKNIENCSCNECKPPYKDDGCKDGPINAKCIKYDGVKGNCIPIQRGEYLNDIIKNIDSKFCDIVPGTDKFVAVSSLDGNPGYLIDKLHNSDTITFSVVNDGGVFKVKADVDIDNLVDLIVNNETLIEAICSACDTFTTTTTLPATTTIPPPTTTSTTTTTTSTTLPINIEVQNNVFNSSIINVLGATGFFLPQSVEQGEIISGNHTSFSGSLSVTISGTFPTSHLVLRRNGIDMECITVSSAGTYVFAPIPFVVTDLCTIEFAANPCVITSTTTIPATTTTSTTTTSTTTTLPINTLVLNNLSSSTITAVSNILGFTLPGTVNPGGFATGNHGSFTSSISVSIGGSPVSGSVSLFVNGSLVECINVFGSGNFVFSVHSFLSTDFITIQTSNDLCGAFTTTSTTSTTTLPATTTTTSTTTTLPATTTTTSTTTTSTTTSTTTVAAFSGLVYFGTNLDGIAPDESEILAGSSVVRDVSIDVPINWGATSPTPVFYWFWIPDLHPDSLKETWFESVLNQGTMLSPSDLFDVPGTVTVSGQSGHVYITEYLTQFTTNDYIFGIL